MRGTKGKKHLSVRRIRMEIGNRIMLLCPALLTDRSRHGGIGRIGCRQRRKGLGADLVPVIPALHAVIDVAVNQRMVARTPRSSFGPRLENRGIYGQDAVEATLLVDNQPLFRVPIPGKMSYQQYCRHTEPKLHRPEEEAEAT